ncbi:metal ABC transporter solute-binding protein, Zn/Mn family [Pseudonocardia sichuanensis]|uniref:Zinc/manganese transport system substrate-binding protein n=1 Tax=Pseudonocardia kunmingensis TaxID=630975 RepID=A0A543D9R6_9PSEU|nr:zinc ABC transporter substrate-binding protein [Pseudonocardia kunmingensis]TQM06084.1 zinc/manganese transport system substrate-binding protein [Pseudonocardia kunmingensis]
MTARRVIPPLVALATALALTACGSGSPAPAEPAPGAPADGGPIAVVASTNVYGSIVEAVGGDAVAVTSIIDNPDADPHEYESTPADAVAVNEAQLVVYNGADYDPFADQLIEAAGTNPTAINVAELSGLEAQVPAGEEFNEHVWYSLPTVKMLADTIAADLGTADPAQASTFTTNATDFTTAIDELLAKLDAIKLAHEGERVAITEPIPVYIIEAAGLVNATPEEFAEAVEEGQDAPALVVAETLALFEGPDPVKALVANTQVEDAATLQVADAATASGVPIVQVTETLAEGTDDYVTWMTQQIDALTAALDGAA